MLLRAQVGTGKPETHIQLGGPVEVLHPIYQHPVIMHVSAVCSVFSSASIQLSCVSLPCAECVQSYQKPQSVTQPVWGLQVLDWKMTLILYRPLFSFFLFFFALSPSLPPFPSLFLTVSLCRRPDWLGTHRNPPVSASRVLTGI